MGAHWDIVPAIGVRVHFLAVHGRHRVSPTATHSGLSTPDVVYHRYMNGSATADLWVRRLYLLASYVLMPPLLLLLAMRDLPRRDNRNRWLERLGRYQQPMAPGSIIIHAASVGEVNAAAPLVRALGRQFPAIPITVTSFTATGSERIRRVFANDVQHVYAPLDLPGAVKRFCNQFRPCILIIMETEIWPNLYITAAQNHIPIVMANARVSMASAKGFRRIRWLTRAALTRVCLIAAQSEADARRLVELGAEAKKIEITGSLKFDISVPNEVPEQALALRSRWGDQRPVFLAASTHEGDEKVVLAAFTGVLKSFPQALLVLAPRHPHRFQRATRLARAAGLPVHLHSQRQFCGPATQCLLVDEMGTLLSYYAACDAAFVGGTFDNLGGHNILEPAALSIPVLIGPYTQNIEDVTAQLLACGGARRVQNAAELEHAVIELLGNAALRRKMGEAAQALVRNRQGALLHTLRIITELLHHSSS